MRNLLLCFLVILAGSLFAERPTYVVAGAISEEGVLRATLTFESGENTEPIKIYLYAAGRDSSGQPVLVIHSIQSGTRSIPHRVADDWLLIEAWGGGQPLVIDYSLDLKAIYDWRSTFGYALFPAHNTDNCWYPDIYLGESRNFYKDFTVELTHPNEWVLLTSGRTEEAQRGATRTRSRFTAKQLRFFGLNAGEDFRTGVVAAEGIEIVYFCPPEWEPQYAQAAAIAAEAITWYVETYGFFPVRQIGLAYGHEKWRGGFPSENMFYIHRGDLGESFLRWITAHELGHYFWGHYVLSAEEDQLNGLMLANGIWADHQYLSAVKQVPLEVVWQDRELESEMILRYLAGVLANVDQRMGISATEARAAKYDYNGWISHGKAATGLYLLSRQMGFATFAALQKELIEEYAYRPLSMEVFLDRCVAAGGDQARSFMRQWMQGDAIIEYEVADWVTEERDQVWTYRFDLVNRGTVDYPIEMVVRTVDGRTIVHRSSGQADREEIRGISPSEPQKVVLDPQGVVPMWNSDHPAIERLYILALDEAGHSRVARQLARDFLSRFPNDRALAEWFGW